MSLSLRGKKRRYLKHDIIAGNKPFALKYPLECEIRPKQYQYKC